MAAEEVHNNPGTAWFAVWTRSRQEKVVAAVLESFDIPHFLPLKAEVHIWSDRKQTVTVPLFPGYLFVHLNPAKSSRLRVISTPGVAGIVGNQSGPHPVPDYEIEGIRTVIAQKVQYSIAPSIPIGKRVRVIRGVLTGVEGVLVRSHADSKLVLSVDAIHQSIVVSVGAIDVEPIEEYSSRRAPANGFAGSLAQMVS